MTKLFVLDTNVILHDSSCIYNFEDNDIVIPITVIEELDKFKKGHETINYHAREFLRALDAISGEKLFDEGVPIAEGKGKIFVKLEVEKSDEVAANFSFEVPDNHILNIMYHIAKKEKDREVILVSKDVNLRLKAKALKLIAQDYKRDKVRNISGLYKGKRYIENISDDVIDKIYQNKDGIPIEDLNLEEELYANEYVILRNGKKSVLGVYDKYQKTIKHIDKVTASGISPRNAEQIFALNALLDPKILLVTLTGKAGTGKTLLALAAALEQKAHFNQILLARPIVPLSNKDLGFLPGDVKAKIEPYMQPLYDNLGVIQHNANNIEHSKEKIKDSLDDRKLVITPLSYIRGRSIVNIFFIVDEAQNLTPHEIKTIITRAGDSTKIVFTGDIYQIDHPYLDTQSNGLSYLIEKMQGQSLYAHVHLEKGERSRLADLASEIL